jgi:RND superfamily putative drug exporter
MAWHLYRLGRAAFRRRWLVLAAWLVVLAGVMVGAATLSGKTSDQFTLPGLESTDAYTLIEERSPQAAPDGATARIVFQAPEGEQVTSAENRRAVEDSLAEVDSPSVLAVADPFASGAVSEDGRTAYATVSYDRQSIELTETDREALEHSVDPAEEAGLVAAVGGDALQEMPEQGSAELVGLLVGAVVLLITLGSLVAAGMPLLNALIGVALGIGAITFATGFIDLGSSAPILASMLGLAVGIDYSLFIVTRYRSEVRAGRDPEEAAGVAVGTAGSAVVFAGLTVVIALVGLAVVNIRFLTEMGIAAAATIAVAVLLALTLLPALLGFAGRRVVRGSLPFLRTPDPEADGGTMGRRWVDLVVRHRALTFVGGVLAAAVVSVPLFSMQLALPDDGTQPDGSDARIAYDLITDGFGAGANGPLAVVVDTAGAAQPGEAVAAVQAAVDGVRDDVAQVVPARPQEPAADAGPEAAQAYRTALQTYEQQLAETDLATITVVPVSGPSDADTQALVEEVRSAVRTAEAATGADVYVTGQTAVGVDVSEKLLDVFPVYLALVVGLALVLLILVFRSLLVPLKAVVGFLLSVGVSLGATVAVFQWGWLADLVGVDSSGPIMAMLPILLVGILFGLAMDYEVFLVSRMREEYVHGRSAVDAVVHGFQHSARVVTAAAVIMIGVFVSFAVPGDAIIKTIGFGLAVGILADAFLVRMTLVPAFMALVGDASWKLPAWLDRLLPNLDIEGESLQRRLADRSAGDERPDPVPAGV